LGRAYRVEIPSFSWQPEHVFGMFRGLTDEDGSPIFAIVCSPWQSVHTGDSAIPPRIPFPWTLFSYCSRIRVALSHIVGMFWRWWPTWADPRQDAVVAVAVDADRAADQTRLLRRHPVDALLVRRHHFLVRQVVLLLNRPVLVASQAGGYDVQLEGPRRGVLRLPDVVLAVASVAPRTSVTPSRAASVGTSGVRLLGVPVHLPQLTFFSFS